MKLKTLFQTSVALLGLFSLGFSRPVDQTHSLEKNAYGLRTSQVSGEINESSDYSDKNEIDFGFLDSITTLTIARPDVPLNVIGYQT